MAISKENTRPIDMKRINNETLAKEFIENQILTLKKQIGDEKVILALSGGVDSSVVAALLIKAIGKNLTCIHVNHGLLRKNESEQVIKIFRKNFNANIKYINASELFLIK